MSVLRLLTVGMALATAALAAEIKTLDGRIFSTDSVTNVEPDGLKLTTSEGIQKIPFTDFPEEVRRRYGYDPARVEELRNAAAEQAKAALLRQQSELRFAKWTQELARKKKRYLTGPIDLAGSGASAQALEEFRTGTEKGIAQFEARLAALRKLIDACDKEKAPLETTQRFIDAVFENKVCVGMPAAFVTLSWGAPTKISSTTDTNGQSEQWSYRREGMEDASISLTNGVVSAIKN